jgi:hypothetical protein
MIFIRLYKNGSAVLINTDTKGHKIEINDEVVGEVEATQENMDTYFPKPVKTEGQQETSIVT